MILAAALLRILDIAYIDQKIDLSSFLHNAHTQAGYTGTLPSRPYQIIIIIPNYNVNCTHDVASPPACLTTHYYAFYMEIV